MTDKELERINSWWSREMPLDQAVQLLSEGHVMHILRQDNPAEYAAALARGQWLANDGEYFSAYCTIEKAIRSGTIALQTRPQKL